MGLEEDLYRYREIIREKRREDLEQFIQEGDLLGQSEREIQVPIHIISLPEFEYHKVDKGGIGQGEDGSPDQGDPVGPPQEQPGEAGEDGDEDGESDEAGEDGGGEHDYYEMSPEEFAEELEDILELELEPKGKKIEQTRSGALTDTSRTGPDSTLRFKDWFKKGLKRKLASQFDEDYIREGMKVEGVTPKEVFNWARNNNIRVSKPWIDSEFEEVLEDEKGKWASFEELEENKTPDRLQSQLESEDIEEIPFRTEDKQYAYPEEETEKISQVVVVNIRDVSGSMRGDKRELVERMFSPLDWYLQGKYSNAEFVYIAHDTEAWEVDREDFFGIRSGGGTQVSAAFELAQEILEEEYPWSEWNRFVFAAGDGENSNYDTEDNVIPLLEEIDANLHAYVETKPNNNTQRSTVGHTLESSDLDNITVVEVNSNDDVLDGIKQILDSQSD